MSNRQVRDQRYAGWCAHYAVTEFLSFYSDEVYSPASSAYTFNEEQINANPKHVAFHHGANPAKVIQNILDQGICTESDFPSVEAMGKAFKEPSLLAEYKNNIGYTGTLSALKRGIQDTILIDKRLTVYSKELQNTYLRHNRQCRKKIKLPPLRFTKYTDHSVNDPNLINLIDQSLKSGKPAIISYNSDALKKTAAIKNSRNKLFSSNHASLIVGRKFNPKTKTCDYLLRNSWGIDACSRYHGTYHCDSEGNLYIPKREVLYSATEVVVAKPVFLPGELEQPEAFFSPDVSF